MGFDDWGADAGLWEGGGMGFDGLERRRGGREGGREGGDGGMCVCMGADGFPLWDQYHLLRWSTSRLVGANARWRRMRILLHNTMTAGCLCYRVKSIVFVSLLLNYFAAVVKRNVDQNQVPCSSGPDERGRYRCKWWYAHSCYVRWQLPVWMLRKLNKVITPIYTIV